MGCCCGKEQVVANPVEERVRDVVIRRASTPREPPPPPLPHIARYAGPPPEFFEAGLQSIEKEADGTRSKLQDTEEIGRERLIDWLQRAVSAQTRLEQERENAKQRAADRAAFEEEELRLRYAQEGACGEGLAELYDELERVLRDQELSDMLKVDVGDVGYSVAELPSSFGMDGGVAEAPAVDFEGVFGRPKILDEDEMSARSAASTRQSTFSAIDWEGALRGRNEGLSGAFSPAPSQTRSDQPSPIRSELLARHPLIALGIDEAGARDEIAREGLSALAAMRLEAFQFESILTRRRYTLPRLLEAHFVFILATCEHTESYHRVDIEHQWLRGTCEVYADTFRRHLRRMQWDAEVRRMEARRNKKAAAQRTLRDGERHADKLRWEVERMRLSEMAGTTALEKMTAELAEVRKLEQPFVVASVGRTGRDQARQQSELLAEEARHRAASQGEESTRWEILWNACAEECPWIVNHPQRDIFVLRKEAEVSKLQLLANAMLLPDGISGVLAGSVDANSLAAARRRKNTNAQLPAHDWRVGRLAVLSVSEEEARTAVCASEDTQFAALLDGFAEAIAVCVAHAKRAS